MPTAIPALTLNNGVEMPALGYGVFQTPPAVQSITSPTACATTLRLDPR